MQKFNELLKTDHELLKVLLGCKSYQDLLTIYFTQCKRLSTKFSYAQFALKAGISKSLVKSILDGKKRITVKTALPICKALSLPQHIDEFFLYLIALEEPKILRPELPLARIRAYLKKFSNLALEEYAAPKTSDVYFRAVEVPYIYAALGTYEEGASLEQIIARTRLEAPVLKEQLKFMITKGAVHHEGERFFASRQFSFLTDSRSNSSFHHIFMALLERNERSAKRNFEDKSSLYYMNVLSVKETDLPELKNELTNVLNKFVQKAEVSDGDKVIAIQLAMT